MALRLSHVGLDTPVLKRGNISIVIVSPDPRDLTPPADSESPDVVMTR
jgi:hypothetical protein